MDETRIQIGDEVLLVVDISADWYISGAGYDGESVNVDLRRKADRYKEWWLADAPQTNSEVTRNSLRTDCTGCQFVGWYDTDFPCVNCVRKNKDYYTAEQTDCPER